ncbi:hypothetical protein A9Q81_20425 [Gammaproteobacteria bacterium 42_54_T18]|nr:hypothetical protein A9Q81_20425 [Gammaproteobacteria bacterium 42_54_T18]
MAKTAGKTQDLGGAKGAQLSRELLIKEAARLFAEKGYNKTNMRELAEAVGMKAGSIFYHFKNKDEILQAVMHKAITLLVANVQSSIGDATTPMERLRVLVRMELGVYLGEDADYGMVLIHEWRSLPESLQEELLVMRSNYESYWDTTLANCQQEGIIKANPKIVRRMLNGAFSWAIYWYQPEGEFSFEQLVDEVMAMLVVG